MKRLILSLITILYLFLNPVYGENEQVGTMGFPVLKIGYGTRASAMGGAFVGLADDASALYWNSAGLSQLTKRDFLFCYQNWFAGIRDQYFSFTQPTNFGTIGIGFFFSSSGEIESWDEENLPSSSFKTHTGILTFSYAKPFTTRFSAGVSSKILYQDLKEESGTAFNSDIGILYKLKKIGIGLNLQNIGTKIYYADSYGMIPIKLVLGARITPFKDLNLVSDLNISEETGLHFHFGGEYSIANMFTIRAGYKTGPQSVERLGAVSSITAGFGINWKNYKFGYTFVPYGILGVTNRFSFGFQNNPTNEGKVIVRIIDKTTGHPLKAIVETYGVVNDTVITDGLRGKCVFSNLPSGDLTLFISKDSYYSVHKKLTVSDNCIEDTVFMERIDSKHSSEEESVLSDSIFGVIYGKVIDNTSAGLLAKVEYKGARSGSPRSGIVFTDSAGIYKITKLPPGKYHLLISPVGKDYFSSEEIAYLGARQETAFITRLENKVILSGFEPRKTQIPKVLQYKLNKIGKFMKEFSGTAIEINGYADPILMSSRKYAVNEVLSRARANAVKDYLIRKFNIAPQRLIIKGTWAEKLPADHYSNVEFKMARKVEIILLGIRFIDMSGLIH